MTSIWLFDIDGTLISTGGAGQRAMAAAMRAAFGRPADTMGVAFSGRTDRSIAQDLFRLHGIDDVPASWENFHHHYLCELEVHLPKCQGTVLPGVRTLLDRLSHQSNTLLGLLTGNVPGGAQRKLRHYGLLHFFAFGAYGDDCCQRDDVARTAQQLWVAHLAPGAAPRQVWVVGDTPHDVECARAIGAKSIAVATGGFTRDELAIHDPDLLVSTLEELDWAFDPDADLTSR